ncbi:MAG: hypothetical protein J3R72DRAFT_454857 [Linnemannia gamsii]|nr:MAG: hypothetical protein J3R72DRAFT_454857 [Linnemannia gamsii]
MTPDQDESIPQGQTHTQTETQAQPTGARAVETTTALLQIAGQGNKAPTTPTSGTSTQKSKPKVYLVGTEGLVWDIQDVRKLRQDNRIAGSLAGSLPRSPMQNIFQGLPLRLLPEEISVLLHHEIIELIVDNPHHLQPPPQQQQQQQQEQQSAHLDAFPTSTLTDRALVFEHLWNTHQFFIAPGMKFGGDYLLYRNDPLVCHASLVASVKEPNDDTTASITLIDLANSARLVSTVQKQHLLCSVIHSSEEEENAAMSANFIAATVTGIEPATVTETATAAAEDGVVTPTTSGSNRRVVAFAVEWAGF